MLFRGWKRVFYPSTATMACVVTINTNLHLERKYNLIVATDFPKSLKCNTALHWVIRPVNASHQENCGHLWPLPILNRRQQQWALSERDSGYCRRTPVKQTADNDRGNGTKRTKCHTQSPGYCTMLRLLEDLFRAKTDGERKTETGKLDAENRENK